MTQPPGSFEPTSPARPVYPAYPGDEQPPPPGPTYPLRDQFVGTPYLQSLRTPAIWVTATAVLVTVVTIIQTAMSWVVQARLTAIYEGATTELGVLNFYDGLSFLYLLTMLGAFIATGVWLHRAHTQAQSVRPYNISRSSGWAWGGWICPVVNLWFPFQVVRDASLDPIGTNRSVSRGWWWAAFLTMLLANRIVDSAFTNSTTPDGFAAIGPTSTFAALATVVALALWMRVVWAITRDHAAAYAA